MTETVGPGTSKPGWVIEAERVAEAWGEDRYAADRMAAEDWSYHDLAACLLRRAEEAPDDQSALGLLQEARLWAAAAVRFGPARKLLRKIVSLMVALGPVAQDSGA